MAEPRTLPLGVRIAGGTLATAVAAVVVAAVAFLPLPTVGPDPRAITVDPAPADQVRVCAGAAMRVGSATGENADSVFAIGSPATTAATRDDELDRARLTSADVGAATASTPEVLQAPATGGDLLAGAQSQSLNVPDFRGFVAASCAEPSGSAWLVGGATTTGRTTLLLLSNPSAVASRVSLEIFGEEGPVAAPGLSGIEVAPGSQRVLSLAGYAPGVVSPIVHVTSRGGRVVATLQHSVVRGLDAVGVESVSGGADPGESLVIPGVRMVDTVGTNRASALSDWHDVRPVVRVLVPGETGGRATVRVVPESADAAGSSFDVEIEPGVVAEIPLDSGAPEGGVVDGADDEVHGFVDGLYTVYVDADVPVVAGVRASTAVDSGGQPQPDAILAAPDSDLAWFSAAPALAGETLVVVPAGPSPIVSIANPTTTAVETELLSLDGAPTAVVAIPAGGTLTVPVAPGRYLLTGATDLSVAVSFAAPGALASFVLAPPRPVAGPIVVRPD